MVGGGSWGTALALHLARGGFEVSLWAHDPDRVREMETLRENRTYLPDFPLPDAVRPREDLREVVAGQNLVILAVPARHFREVLERAVPALDRRARLVIGTKGIEPGTGRRMSEVVGEYQRIPSGNVAALAGPGFAREVARGDPTAGVLGCSDPEEGARLQEAMSHEAYRFYTNRDLIGVELGGALKNIIALAAGVVEGLGFGSNTAAALMTRGLSEITRLGVACGGAPSTFAGLAGMGDLVLTCTGRLSRNRFVGVQLGQGRPLEEILAGMKMVAEGVPTTAAALEVATRHSVEMPISASIQAILDGRLTAREAVTSLLKRPLKGEDSWE